MNQHLIAGLLAVAVVSTAYAEEPANTKRELALVTASIETVPNNHYLDGSVDAVNKSTVSAQTGGQIQEILFDVDDFVEKDQVILYIKDTTQRAALERAEAELNQAQASLERINRVIESGAATEAQKDLAETAFKSAKAAVESAREQLEYTVVRAPYTGIVTERHVQPGEVATPGTLLVSGISLEQMRVNVDVPQSLINRVREYQSAFILTGEGPVLQAEKITIFPYADQATNSFRVRLELPENDQDLFPGMFVKVGFFTGTTNLLMAPSSSIVYRSEVTGIYVASESGKISFRHIRTGRQIGDKTVILSGIEPGEQVAVDPVAAPAIRRSARRA